MVTADQLAWVLGSGLVGLVCWSVGKIFDRTVSDIGALRDEITQISELVRAINLKLSILEERIKDQ